MADEQVGRHKGAVETLLHEKKELSRLLQIVNSQLEKHLSALEEAGVDTDGFIQEIQQESQQNRQEQVSQDRSRQEADQSSQEAPETGGTTEDDGKEVDEFFEDDDEEDGVPDDFSPV